MTALGLAWLLVKVGAGYIGGAALLGYTLAFIAWLTEPKCRG